MPHWQMYQKPKYGQDDMVWVKRGAEQQPVKGQSLDPPMSIIRIYRLGSKRSRFNPE